MRLVGHIARMEEMRNAYRMLVGKPEEKKPLRRPRRRWENRIEWIIECHQCLTCFKGLCVYAPR
jgi:hypothetical protein